MVPCKGAGKFKKRTRLLRSRLNLLISARFFARQERQWRFSFSRRSPFVICITDKRNAFRERARAKLNIHFHFEMVDFNVTPEKKPRGEHWMIQSRIAPVYSDLIRCVSRFQSLSGVLFLALIYRTPQQLRLNSSIQPVQLFRYKSNRIILLCALKAVWVV